MSGIWGNIWPDTTEDADLGEGGVQLAWDEQWCDTLVGRMVRFNGNAYMVGLAEDQWGASVIRSGTEGWIITVLPPASDEPEMPVQFRTHWRGQDELMYVDATCVTVLAVVPDLQDTRAVEEWLTAS